MASNVYNHPVFSLTAQPSAPSMLKVLRVSRDTVTLQWAAPYSDGGAEIDRYVIMMKNRPVESWHECGSVSGRTTSYTVTGLREGKNHYFAVFAENSVGRGHAMETERPTQPKRQYTSKIISYLKKTHLNMKKLIIKQHPTLKSYLTSSLINFLILIILQIYVST